MNVPKPPKLFVAFLLLGSIASLGGVAVVLASYRSPIHGTLALGAGYRGHCFVSDGRATICIEEEGGQSLPQMMFGRNAVPGIRYFHRVEQQQVQMRAKLEKQKQELEKRLGSSQIREMRDMEARFLEDSKRAQGKLLADLYKLVILEASNLPKRHGYAGLVFKYDSDSEERLVLSLPPWFLLVVFLTGPGLLIFRIVRGRRRYSILACKRCGYNLTGSVSGRCSECGTLIPDEQRKVVALEAAAEETSK